jgi:hypothetical protein
VRNCGGERRGESKGRGWRGSVPPREQERAWSRRHESKGGGERKRGRGRVVSTICSRRQREHAAGPGQDLRRSREGRPNTLAWSRYGERTSPACRGASRGAGPGRSRAASLRDGAPAGPGARPGIIAGRGSRVGLDGTANAMAGPPECRVQEHQAQFSRSLPTRDARRRVDHGCGQRALQPGKRIPVEGF